MVDRTGSDVILDVDFEDGLLHLAVRNIGDRPAFDVATRFDQPLLGLGGERDVATLPLFERIAFLAPRKEIRTLLDSTESWFGRGQPTTITARVRYRDEAGQEREGTMVHDLEIYRDIAYARRS
jgi:hypothetical protein